MIVSFIIPAYNASKTIDRCLNSIYALGMLETDYEIIVIDDASSDDTVRIVKTHSESHGNLILLTQSENHRQGAARNRGLAVANGDYIVFLDSDDEIRPGVCHAIVLAQNNDLDIAIMKGEAVSLDGQVTSTFSLPYEPNEVFSGISFQTAHRFWCPGPVLYVFKKDFLDYVDYPFAEDVLYEDSDFVNVHLYYSKRTGYCNDCGYYIHVNTFSTTHTMSYKHVCDYALLGTRMLAFHNSIEKKDTPYAESILEGGSWNIMQSCRNLFKLESRSDIRAFYDRFDRFADRKSLVHYREPAYCWTPWTRFCIRHRKMTTSLVGLCLSTGVIKLIKNRHRK